MQHGGAPPLEQRAQLVGPARGGHAHGEARERPVGGVCSVGGSVDRSGFCCSSCMVLVPLSSRTRVGVLRSGVLREARLVLMPTEPANAP